MIKRRVHASESAPRPPYHYICHRCGERGHWKDECPTLNDANFVPLTETRPSTGIPKSFLRPAKTEEEKKNAMVDRDGNLVVYKNFAVQMM